MIFKKVYIFILSEMFNFYNYFLFKYLTRVRKYERVRVPNTMPNEMFDVFIMHNPDMKRVLKIPKRNTTDSLYFTYKIFKNSGFKDYLTTLNSLNNLPYISKHVYEASKIYRNGGYVSKFVDGINMEDIVSSASAVNTKLGKNISLKIVAALKELLIHLEEYCFRYGYIPGDWKVHNLIYDISKGIIINIDLEGFYTFKKNNIENDLNYLKVKYMKIIELLEK